MTNPRPKRHRLEFLNPFNRGEFLTTDYPYNYYCLDCGKRFVAKYLGEAEKCRG